MRRPTDDDRSDHRTRSNVRATVEWTDHQDVERSVTYSSDHAIVDAASFAANLVESGHEGTIVYDDYVI